LALSDFRGAGAIKPPDHGSGSGAGAPRADSQSGGFYNVCPNSEPHSMAKGAFMANCTLTKLRKGALIYKIYDLIY